MALELALERNSGVSGVAGDGDRPLSMRLRRCASVWAGGGLLAKEGRGRPGSSLCSSSRLGARKEPDRVEGSGASAGATTAFFSGCLWSVDEERERETRSGQARRVPGWALREGERVAPSLWTRREAQSRWRE